MKKKAMMGIVAALCLGSGMTAFAAPEIMPDGTVFDAEYYAQIYPDVVAVFGTDADAMYRHYLKYGRNEGRLAYDITVQFPAQTEEKQEIMGIQGIPGELYNLPTWGEADSYDGSAVVDRMITMTVRTTVPDLSQVELDMESLAPYTREGYEWRPIFYVVNGESSDNAVWWAGSNWFCDVEHSKDWITLDDGAGYKRKFTVTQNGADYTECILARSLSDGQYYGEALVDTGIWLLLPKGYDGNIYFAVTGQMLGEDGLTANEDAAVTFVY